MIKYLGAFSFSLGLLLAVTLTLVGLVPVYDLVQDWAGVEESSGYSRDYLHEVNRAMRDYLYGYRPDLIVEKEGGSLFQGQEIFHMAEVKKLFTGLARASLALLLVGLLLSLKFKTRLFKDQLLTMLGLLGTLGLMSLFFDKSFVLVHRIFFNNELWLFPWDSQLITILPQNFFFYFALLIIGVFASGSLLIYFLERIYYDFASRQG
ncbi:MAG: DUF1461 domain-containing protein [Tissierellia bacterium]|nr:DUF1461 domain-containing protein [Tissierellia bacterium]